MYYVNWDEAQEFCKKLSESTGRKYVLPTEAQWEYAARGGNKSQHYKYAGSNDIDEVAWYRENSYALGKEHPDYGTHPVGTKKPNELGIYDMSGNVWELCSDDMYDNDNIATGDRVIRGGGLNTAALICWLSWCRSSVAPKDNGYGLGFRVACIAE